MAEDSRLEILVTVKDQASKALSGLGKVASGVLKAGLVVGAAGLTALGAGLAYSIGEAMEAQEVQAQLNAVLKATGGIAGVTAEEATAMADSLSQVTRFSDETVLSTETMLLQFKGINEEVFPQTTELALDLATRLGTDTTSAAKLLGKALEQPGEGLMGLKRAGVAFTDEQEDMIKGMVEAGDTAGAQKYILDALSKSIGGAARASGQTLPGQLDILKNQLSNVAESVGTALLPVLTNFLQTVIIPMIPKIQDLAARFTEWLTSLSSSSAVGWFQTMMTTIQTFVTTVLVPFVQQHAEELKGALIAIGAVLAAAGIIGGVIAIGAAIGTLLTPIGLVIAIAAVLGAAWAGNWGGIQEKTMAVINFLKPIIQGFITGIKTWWDENGAQIIAAAQAIWDGIIATFEFFKGLFQGAFEAWSLGLQGDWRGMGEKLRQEWDKLWATIKTIVSTAITNIKNSFKNTNWGEVGRSIIQGVASGITAALDIIKNAAIAAARAAFEAAKGFLGIDSPSKVFKLVGEQMMQGMAGGIRANMMLPRSAVTTASAGALSGVRGGGAGGGLTINLYITAPDGASAETIASLAASKVITALGQRRGSWGYSE